MQGRSKCSYFILFVASLLMGSCIDMQHEPTEAELSAFGEYVYRLDTARMEHTLNALLAADTARWEADRVVRQRYAAVEAFAEAPLWFERMGVAEEAGLLLTHLRNELPRAGLDSTAFFVPQIAAGLEVVRTLTFDSLGLDINDVLVNLDYNLSRAYVRYVVGQRYGFVRPDRLFNHSEMKADSSGWAQLFDYEVKPPDYHEAMRVLDRSYNENDNDNENEAPQVGASRFSRDDSSAERVAYLEASAPKDPTYRALQQRLLQTTDAAERHTLAVNMERCRWQMKRPDATERMVVVNIPAQQLWAACPDSVVNMRICCGATTTKTPLLNSTITHIQVNPDWIITPNIIKNEVARHAGDSAYFARHRYYITNRQTGDTLNPRQVTASQLKSGRLRVGQHGGAGNSLGRIVFRFPNNFSVYLHDTNNPSAFRRERRTLSHGCIRVEKPFDLALFLLPTLSEWETDRLRISMDLKPQTKQGKEYLKEHADDTRPLRLIKYRDLSPRIPVYLIYHTAYPTPGTGEIEFWPDLYGYDKLISQNTPVIK